MFYDLPKEIQEQAIKKHNSLIHGELKDANQWHPVQEWKTKGNFWSLTIGDYRAYCKKDGNNLQWWWIGNKQSALKLLTSNILSGWYKIAKIIT